MGTQNKALSANTLATIFTDAHTYNGWQEREVSDETLRELYATAVMGPTSANCLPMRVVFVKSQAGKERLVPHLMEGNREKTQRAPVTAIIAYDLEFYREMPRLFPVVPKMGDMFKGNPALAERYAIRNGSLQGAYFIITIRAMGFGAGPMSGFDNDALDKEFFAGTSVRSNFLCNFGYGDESTIYPRNPRLTFDEACTIV